MTLQVPRKKWRSRNTARKTKNKIMQLRTQNIKTFTQAVYGNNKGNTLTIKLGIKRYLLPS